jgi:hypothetical protein
MTKDGLESGSDDLHRAKLIPSSGLEASGPLMRMRSSHLADNRDHAARRDIGIRNAELKRGGSAAYRNGLIWAFFIGTTWTRRDWSRQDGLYSRNRKKFIPARGRCVCAPRSGVFSPDFSGFGRTVACRGNSRLLWNLVSRTTSTSSVCGTNGSAIRMPVAESRPRGVACMLLRSDPLRCCLRTLLRAGRVDRPQGGRQSAGRYNAALVPRA